MNNINTNNLYKTINELCDSNRDWEEESISFSRIDKLINDNLDHFFSPSEEYGMKAKFESLLNLSERVKKEFNNDLGKILAFSIQGIANEVLNEGVHFEPSLPPEIIEQIIFFMIWNNEELANNYPRNSDLIWRKFKLNVDNVLLRLLENCRNNLFYLGISNSLEAVDFYVDHKHQVSKADLRKFDISKQHLEKLAKHCPHLQSLKLRIDRIGQEGANFIGNLCALKKLHIDSPFLIPQADLSLILKKLTELTGLSIYNKAYLMPEINYIENMTILRSLNLVYSGNMAPLSLSLEKLTSLTSLSLIDEPFLAVDVSVIGKMTDLKSLRLESNDNIPGRNLSHVLAKLSSLTSLTLINEPFLAVDVNVMSTMTGLKSLILESHVNISDRNLTIVLEKLTSLTELRLNGKACQEPEVTKAIEKMNSLTSLNLLSNKSIPEMNLLTTLKKLTLLENVNLRGTSVTLEILPLAIEQMTALRELTFSHYNYSEKDKLNRLISVLKKHPSLKAVFTSFKMIDALKPDLNNICFWPY